ncbi:anti-sigma factor domain-containing protein [Actinomycetospora straminea]|uniref:Regulator of SigK n=1 Tax=Actinomycetospora straminea TaxID=663607 RepID=A0ABP9DY24_9PSEU|nr:anti-sigma factor [Actinomycetospora straminea]MDD7934166.1 anti-sigma factor [Actinomycetospora straminea]
MSDHAAPGAPADHTADHDALAVAHALHALDHDEETAFGAHLAGCPVCRRTVDDTTAVLGDLAGAVEPVDPPAGLRQRLLDAAEAEEAGIVPGPVPPSRTADSSRSSRSSRPEPAEPSSSGSTAPRHARDDADDAGDTDDGTVVPLAPRRRRATRWLAAAAAVVVVIAIGGLTAANQSLRAERDSAQAAAAAQAQREAAITDVLADAGTPGVPHAVLATPQGGLVGVVVDDGTGRRVLATGLGPNGSDEVYVLWGLADGTPRPLGTFDIGGQGPDVRSVPSTPEAVPYAGFAVSLEPGRTAPASPTRVVASGQVGR